MGSVLFKGDEDSEATWFSRTPKDGLLKTNGEYGNESKYFINVRVLAEDIEKAFKACNEMRSVIVAI
jgi:hypothetical protein